MGDNRYVPVVAALIGVALSLALAMAVQLWVATELRAKSERHAGEHAAVLEEAFHDAYRDVEHIGEFMVASGSADAEDFRTLTNTLFDNHPAIMAVALVEGRADGNQTAPSLVVKYAESSDPRYLRDLDLESGDIARTLEAAFASGETAVSAALQIDGRSTADTAVLAAQPVYPADPLLGQLHAGGASTAMVALIDPDVLLEETVFSEQEPGFDYHLVDTEAAAGGELLASVHIGSDGSRAPQDPADHLSGETSDASAATLLAGDRMWRLDAMTPGGFGRGLLHSWDGGLLAVAGLMVGLLLTAGLVQNLRVLRRLADHARIESAALGRAAAEVLASEERFRATFEQAAVGVGHADFDGRLIRVNEKFCELLGYSREELVGKSMAELTHHEDREHRQISLAALRSGEIDSYATERRYIRKDGSFVWTRLTASLVHDPDGAPVYVMGVIEDISAQKALEESLVEAQTQLLQSQKLEAVGQLAGGIAHDFNNLLQTILGTADLARESLATGMVSSARADLDEIRAAAERAAELTGKLLAFSRRQPLAPRVFRLDQLISSMAGLLERTIGDLVEFSYQPDPTVGPVMADPHQLGQVVLNLVINARDAMPQGGTITVRTAEVELDDAFVASHPGAHSGPHAVLTVSDNGHGMDREVLSHILEPFFTTKEQGTGLGLATCYGIVKQSGGTIWVRSEPGQGTTVDIYLDLRRDPVDWPDRPVEEISSRDLRGPETILVVEDEPRVRSLVVRILVKQGYSVLAASAPEEAIALLERDGAPRVDLLLTDVIMPGMSGRELALKLGAGDNRPARTLYMSGYTRDVIFHDGHLDSEVVLLEKPFTADALTRTVRQVLDESSVRSPNCADLRVKPPAVAPSF